MVTLKGLHPSVPFSPPPTHISDIPDTLFVLRLILDFEIFERRCYAEENIVPCMQLEYILYF